MALTYWSGTASLPRVKLADYVVLGHYSDASMARSGRALAEGRDDDERMDVFRVVRTADEKVVAVCTSEEAADAAQRLFMIPKRSL